MRPQKPQMFAIYSQQTHHQRVSTISGNRGSLELWKENRKALKGTTPAKPYKRREVIEGARRDCETLVATIFDPKTRIFTITEIAFDSGLRNSESLRRIKNMLRQAEADAIKNSAIKIETNFTIMPPHIAKRFGYEKISQRGNAPNLNFKYEKRLYPPKK